MQELINIQSKKDNRITVISVAAVTFFMNSSYAKAVNLTKAQTALNALKSDLDKIIPLAAGVILLCLAIGYAGRYIGKDTFVRWAIGVVIAGSAAQLANLLFKGAAS
ncbi:VirB2 family type IV secretion system major pilin TrwL [Bartonella krasnovii]|uniref:TrwL5 protein n=1 Tax=Bartonella krasnovii TaxID=2267275 RepID=A0A5B9D2Y0_9HYPH|nr:VirB2 family type IV secretion system major pilin TrwL [Bartonella krasnovii]QEE12878.1 TrwL5 protein [Bartonella krasnovii]UNF42065.1 VirB2 family type IV secretion system major pilin TrwL [Bartonella krasnovii]UNF53573.1 VirB2 family type IV secretion system major pilin TrwL [Bartonella krasnovii]UNF55271.1 VirB2 family type IV secretion system major pilin TrwL [Bartonella krasnovii]